MSTRPLPPIPTSPKITRPLRTLGGPIYITVFDERTYTETVIDRSRHTITKVEFHSAGGRNYRTVGYCNRYLEQVEC